MERMAVGIRFLRLVTVVLGVLSLLAAQVREQGPEGEEVRLAVGRSVVLDRSEDIQRLAIVDTNVADAVAITSRELLINANAPGVTNIVLWSSTGDRHFFTVKIRPDVEQLQDHILKVFPDEDIRVDASDGVITLSGNVSSQEVAEKFLGWRRGLGVDRVDRGV